MSDLFAVGIENNEPFCVTLDAHKVSQLITCTINGWDGSLETVLNEMPDIERKVVDAMCWEDEYFLRQMNTIITRHGRFAIKHNELTFGVSTNWDMAKTAFDNKEF